MAPSIRLAVVSLLFLLSGAAGLIYEIAWERLLELYFGVTMTAITLIVASYMCGIGIGSLLGGHLARKLRSPVLVYGLIEAAIGVFGIFSPTIINSIGRGTAGAPYTLVFVLSFLVLLIPTLLMGMTLPLLTQSFVDRVETSGRIIGLLYGINTLGAAAGALIAGFVLIGLFGFDGAIYIAAGLNLGVALLAIAAARSMNNADRTERGKAGTVARRGYWSYTQILAASFLVGFIGLGFEMVWIRILHVINKNAAYGFPSILFVFLAGLALGGYFWGRRADKSAEPEKLFWQIEVGGGIAAAFVFLLFWYSLGSGWPGWLGDLFDMQRPGLPFVKVEGTFLLSKRLALASLVQYFLPIIVMVFPASFILGGGLPVLDRIALTSPEVAGRRVGDIHLLNILGSIFGSLLISFWMLPVLGSEWTYRVLLALVLIFPAMYFAARYRGTSQLRLGRLPAAGLGILLLCLLLLPGRGQFYSRLFAAGTGNEAAILETGDSVLTLTLDPQSNLPNMLWIGGEINSLYPSDSTYESRALACAGAARPKRILVVGMGGGIAARFLQTIEGVEEIVIVELMDGLDDLLRTNIDFSRHVFGDHRVKYRVNDGRRYLYANPDEKFDLIFADPLRWHSAGHNNLYSVEMMQLYGDHLTENGIFCAFADERHAIPLTMATAFGNVDHFDIQTIVAGNEPIVYHYPYMHEVARQYFSVSGNSLSPDRILSTYLRDRTQILDEEQDAPVLTDLEPGLEYYFLNAPIRTPIRSRGNFEELLLHRIAGCDEGCRQQILDLIE